MSIFVDRHTYVHVTSKLNLIVLVRASVYGVFGKRFYNIPNVTYRSDRQTPSLLGTQNETSRLHSNSVTKSRALRWEGHALKNEKCVRTFAGYMGGKKTIWAT
jgi:hypothetical protein